MQTIRDMKTREFKITNSGNNFELCVGFRTIPLFQKLPVGHIHSRSIHVFQDHGHVFVIVPASENNNRLVIEAYDRNGDVYFSFDTAHSPPTTTTQHPVKEIAVCENHSNLLDVINKWFGEAVKKQMITEGTYQDQNPTQLVTDIFHGFYPEY